MSFFSIYHKKNTIFIVQSQTASIAAPKDHIYVT